jgi:ribosomal protein L7/L12
VNTKLENTAKSVAQMLLELKANGATPVEAIKAIHNAYGLSLSESKRLFSLSPVWEIETASGDVLHGEVMSAADSDKRA